MQDLVRDLTEAAQTLVALAEHGEPSYFDDLDWSERVEALTIRAAALGAPPEPEALLTTREALARVGRLLAYFRGQQEWLSAASAADSLGVGLQTIYDLVQSGRLPAQRFGTGRGTIRIRRDDLDALNQPQRPLRHV